MQSVNEFSINSIKDLIEFSDKVASPARKELNNSKTTTYLGGSLSNYTKNLVMTFPCMCDDSLSPSTASMISRANERNIVTMLHMLFSAINMDSAKDAVSIIQGIHNNIKTNYDIDDYVDFMADMGELPLSSTQESAIIANMIKQIKEAKSFPTSSLNENAIGNYEIYNSGNGISIREARYKSGERTTTDNSGKETTTTDYKYYNKYNPEKGTKHEPKEGEGRTPDDLDYEHKINQVKKDDLDIQDYYDNKARNKRQDERDRNKDQMTEIEKRLLDADVKKANEMKPALMIISYNQINQDGTPVGKTSFVAGVKSRLIPVESQDIIERIFAKNKTKVNFKNFIRATTGEISFVKDFLLCINQAKIDAKNASKKGLAATMWKTLENRSIKNNFNRIRREGNDASAITVLVVSQETVNALNKYYHIDLSKVKTAKDVMTTYNLMGIVIADDSIERAKFLYAGNDMWDTQAYSYLEKEGKDKSYKDVVNLLNKNMI